MQSFQNTHIIDFGATGDTGQTLRRRREQSGSRICIVPPLETTLKSLAAPIVYQKGTVGASRRMHSLGRIEIPKGMEYAI